LVPGFRATKPWSVHLVRYPWLTSFASSHLEKSGILTRRIIAASSNSYRESILGLAGI
jgi:hypothetical protein